MRSRRDAAGSGSGCSGTPSPARGSGSACTSDGFSLRCEEILEKDQGLIDLAQFISRIQSLFRAVETAQK